MKNSIFIVILFIFFIGCAHKKESVNFDTLKPITLEDIKQYEISEKPLIEIDLDNTIKELNTKDFNSRICVEFIGTKANYLLNNGEKEYIGSKKQLKLIANRSYMITKKLFILRLRLREKLITLHNESDIDDVCLSSFRKAFRYIRFLEEFITEIGVAKYNNRTHANPYDFSTNVFQFYLNPKYKNFELKSGDVLLMRPSNYVSAAIARIGDDDGQFSHGALVYIDESEQIFIIESLISKGLVITAYENWRKQNNNARIVQFRMHNSKKAALLAKKFYEKRKQNFNNKSIIYDFQMDETTINELFCTEVILQTFKNEDIPSYKTSFTKFKNHEFLKKLTIVVSSAFAPSDIEIEAKFELVSEWRNYNTTNLTRIQDAIITSIFKWMSNDNYRLKSTFGSLFKTNVGYYGRHLLGLFDDKIPANMPYGFLQTIVELGAVNDLLEKHLVEQNKNHILKYGYPMTYIKMLMELEKFKSNKELNKIFNSI